MAIHVLMNGRLRVKKRDSSRYWQCHARIDGQRYRESTQRESVEEAIDFAEDWYLTLRGKIRAGDFTPMPRRPTTPTKRIGKEKTFREASDTFFLEYDAITGGQRSPEWVEAMKNRARLYLNPFFGDLGMSEVTAGKAQEYRLLRATNSKNGKPPSRSTMHHEIVILRQILKTAIRHGWLGALPDLSMPYKTAGKIAHRAWFSPEEYKRLYEATRERAKAPKTKRWKWTSEQMHDYVLFMGNTGLRPDEALRLQFRDVQIVEDAATRQRILEIEVRGKRGVGYCKSMNGAVQPFERLSNRLRPDPDNPGKQRKPEPTDPVFPGHHRELFNDLLDELKLKFDRDGNRRTAYSLRHTYICMRLMEGADIYAIAKNCRTSVEMIEKFYASHIKTALDTKMINVRRRKPSAGPKKDNGKSPAKSDENKTKPN